MKKQECIYCNNDITTQHCPNCDRRYGTIHSVSVDPNLYAAEFLLYAFHYDNHVKNENRNIPTPANPLMMLLAEG